MQRKQQAASEQGDESGSIFASRVRPVYFNALARKRYRGLTSALTVASFLATAGSGAVADDATAQGKPVAQPTNEQLIDKLERMEARIQSLESELHRKGAADSNHGSKARVANTRGNGTKVPADDSDAAEAASHGQPTVPGPTPPRKRAPAAAWNPRLAISAPRKQPRSNRRRPPITISSASPHRPSPASRSAPMANSASERNKIRTPRGNGKPASTPRGSCCCQPISSTTTSSSIRRSSSSTGRCV
jgi:hypothetical protein